MASHYADMGIKLNSQEEMADFIFTLAKESNVYDIKGGILGVSDIDGRLEFWIAGNENGEIHSISFNAITANRTLIKAEHLATEETFPIVYAMYSSGLSHGEQDTYGIEFPIVFEAVNYMLSEASCEEPFDVQLTAFANNMSIYTDDETYHKLSSSPMAPESFIPSGTFSPGGEEIIPPTADAIFCGHILSAERLYNTKGGLWYWHIVASCLGCVFDILASDELVTEEPKAGGVVSGSFWLSGKILEIT